MKKRPNEDLIKLVLYIFLILQWSIVAILIFRTRFLTNLLFKNENDTDEISISSFDSIHLFKLGFVLLGVSILVFSLPDFIVEFSKYIYSVQMGNVNRKFELTNILILGLKLLFSLVLIINSTRLSIYFSKSEIIE